ncbi:hypothetical protein GUITHDRAFT_132831 [Guillardia theta CCMP2712]|uniref:Uncharacterized protein n=2 Tax=Guillardia theta TaxID=55529 RepID=L1JZS6_GUITC|nr:hypothetical protein GUITHDRAFT_132831 [Guillardia theta CCMP2712]EKX53779.1 hypothetical protein GUITHDRAFT_132831 [Guillardia theta CCMP2712]|eukprot:XP_005840759.1 hypothetical protein GUITHDRAFT_132831 [Guillardia theta CCMP2712]
MAGRVLMVALVALTAGQGQETWLHHDRADHPAPPFCQPLLHAECSLRSEEAPALPCLRVVGGRGKLKQMSKGAKVRRQKKKKQTRKQKREDERKKRKEEFSMEPVRIGGGLVHPTRLGGVTKEDVKETLQQKKQPLSRIKSRLKLKQPTKKAMAGEIGHYPRKANFMPKRDRRKLRKLQALQALKQRKDSIAGQKRQASQVAGRNEEEEEEEESSESKADGSEQAVASDESLYEGDFETLEEEKKHREMLARRSLLSVQGKEDRLQSFVSQQSGYPHGKKGLHRNLTPENLAEAGFRYLPDCAGSDQTVFEQTGELFKDWQKDDVPMQISVGLLENMYWSKRFSSTSSEVARQIEFTYRVLGNTEEAERWHRISLEEAQAKQEEAGAEALSRPERALAIADDVIRDALAEDEMDKVLKENALTWKQRAQQLTQLPKRGKFEWEKYMEGDASNAIPMVTNEHTEGRERKARPIDPQESMMLKVMKEDISLSVNFREETVLLNNLSFPLPTSAPCKFDDLEVEGDRLNGVNFSQSGMRVVRVDVSAHPIVRWATNLLTGADKRKRSSWSLRVVKNKGRIVVGFLGSSLQSSYNLELNSAVNGFLLDSNGKAVRTSEDILRPDRLGERQMNVLELAKLHRKLVTGECRRNATVISVREPPSSSPDAKSHLDLSFGQDSIIVLTIDRRRQRARIDVYKSQLLDHVGGLGRVSTGRLESVVSFRIQGVANDSVPFVVLEEYGDTVDLMTRRTFKKELMRMIDPFYVGGRKRRKRRRLPPVDREDLYVERACSNSR